MCLLWTGHNFSIHLLVCVRVFWCIGHQLKHTSSYLQCLCSSSIDTSLSLSHSLPASLAQLGDWVCEKMLMARDSSRDETQKLHKKWLKHQAFMAELAQNKEWLDKIEKVSAAGPPNDFSYSCAAYFSCLKVHRVILVLRDFYGSLNRIKHHCGMWNNVFVYFIT